MSGSSTRASARKGLGAIAIMGIVCAFIILGMFAISALRIYVLTKDMTETLDLYIHKDDESSSLAGLMGAERDGFIYMELLGYKTMKDYSSYVGLDLLGVQRTMGEMGTTYNLDIYYNTQIMSQSITFSGGTKTITVPVPDAEGKCRTDTNPGLFLSWPLRSWVQYSISSGFGWRSNPTSDAGECKCHGGIDIVADIGSSILAAADGEVVFAGVGTPGSGYDGYGWTVSIYHEDYGYSTLYGHLLENSITVKKGQDVKRGEVIGQLGNTGTSTGPHLHFEVDRGKGRKTPSDARNICVFLENVPAECIHGNVDVCLVAGLTNTGATAQTIGMTTGVEKPATEGDVTILPEDYITEIPLPGAQLSYIKGVVGGLVA